MTVSNVLSRIKRLILAGDFRFTEKAHMERIAEFLSEQSVIESIVNAQSIYKVLRSRSRTRKPRMERLYVIKSFDFDNVLIYTKGKIVREADREVYYLLVSSKISE